MSNSTTTPTITPTQLRTKVGVYDNPAKAIKEILTDSTTEALRIHTDSPSKQDAYVTIKEGEAWGVAEHNDGKLVEGPLTRQHLISGLTSAQQLSIVPDHTAPFEYEMRK